MYILLAVISLLAGIVAPFLASITFVLYFSGAAASAIAMLLLVYGGGWSTALLAWLTTVFAMQVGFAISTFFTTLKVRHDMTLGQSGRSRSDAMPGHPLDPGAGRHG